MNRFAEGVFLIDGDPLRMLGIPFRTRMTAVVLADGGVWLHSPVAPTPERVEAIRSLGPIRHLVAPSTFHHLFVDAWHVQVPEARVWSVPGLAEREHARALDEVLGDEAPEFWREDLDQLVFRGSTVLLEVVFYHRASRTLILTDIVQNHEPSVDGWFWRTVKRVNGVSAPDGSAPRDWRLTVRDRDAARDCRDRMLAWPFERVVLAHGRCIEDDAHAHIERAFAWLD